MKRDMNLARKVLGFIEARGTKRFKGKIQIEGHERDEIIYHLQLLADAGFVELGQDTLVNMGPLILTWKGCDLLDELRQQKT